MKRWFWRRIPLYGAMGVAGAIGYAITGSGQQAVEVRRRRGLGRRLCAALRFEGQEDQEGSRVNDMNLPSLIERFGSERKCRAYLESLRWPDGVECPRCHPKKISRLRTQAVRVLGLSLPVQRHGGHDHARLAPSALEVVPRDLPHGRVQEGHQRQAASADARRVLQDRLVPLPPHP